MLPALQALPVEDARRHPRRSQRRPATARHRRHPDPAVRRGKGEGAAARLVGDAGVRPDGLERPRHRGDQPGHRSAAYRGTTRRPGDRAVERPHHAKGAGGAAQRLTATATPSSPCSNGSAAPAERRRDGTARQWATEAPQDVDDLNVIAVRYLPDERVASLPDDAFVHDGQITKHGIRAVTLAALAPRPGAAVMGRRRWLGQHRGRMVPKLARLHARWLSNATSGAASTSVSMPRLSESASTCAARRRTRSTAQTAPSAIFLGGGLTQPGLLDACLDHLTAGGRLVANAVTVESESVLAQAYSQLRRRPAALPALSRRAAGRLHRLAPAASGHPVGGDQAVTVYFIGAGPGAADLITVRGQRLLERCPVCLYAGSIMPDDLLALCPPDAKVIDTGPLTLEQIVAEIADADAAGRDVARLHSGDPSLYSALAEQCRRLDALGIGYEIVPGVPAFAAAAAALHRELTVPGVAQTVTLTRVATLSTPMPPGEDLADPGPVRRHPGPASGRRADRRHRPAAARRGYRPETPTAVVAFASWPEQTVLRGTLGDIAAQMHGASITKTAVIIVGDVLAAEGFTDSYLYSAARPPRGSTDAGAAARRHRRGARPGENACTPTSTSSVRWPAGCRTRPCRWARCASAGSVASTGCEAGCATNASTPSSTPPIRSRRP